MPDQLTLRDLHEAICGTAAAFRCRTKLQPAGGEGTKVFPPTYAGAVYATENRRLPNREKPVPCVLLDSVQSQANRMEEALQQAVDDGRLKLPLVEVDFRDYFPGDDKDKALRLLDPVGRVSSLELPHRIADAILRDSELDGTTFRETDEGKRIGLVSLHNATALFELCPTALLFGMWDSTGPKGGLGAKFERAMVSEIVGIDAVYGVKTSSRIDPLAIQKDAGPIYQTNDGGWTLDESVAKTEKNKPVKRGKDGKPSEANHGNVTPDIVWEKDVNGNIVWYRRREQDDLIYDPQKDMWKRPVAGGVTIAKAEQTIVLSLPALRRLRFPDESGDASPDRHNAARTVLAALGLCAAALADHAGLDLRSRCLLYPDADLTWDLLDRKPGGQFTLPAEDALELFQEAVEAAKKAGLPWREEPLTLKPSEQLVKLVVKSQQLAAQQGGGEE